MTATTDPIERLRAEHHDIAACAARLDSAATAREAGDRAAATAAIAEVLAQVGAEMAARARGAQS